MYFKRRFNCLIVIVVITVFVFIFSDRDETSTDLLVDTVTSVRAIRMVTDSLPNNACSYVSMDDIARFSSSHKYRNNIPKIIHYVYKDSNLPVQYFPLIRGCTQHNKDAMFLLWTDETSHAFVLKYFPDMKALYESYFTDPEPLKMSDIIRYLLLLRLGGVYMDLDVACQIPLDDYLTNHSCILSREPETQTRIVWDKEFYAMNSFMACVPNHPFFDRIASSLSFRDDSWVLAQTGPLFLTQVYLSYMNMSETEPRNPEAQVFLAPLSWFGSIMETWLDTKCEESISSWRLKGCLTLQDDRRINQISNRNAAVVHLFFHLGYSDQAFLIRKRKSICALKSTINRVQIL